MSNPERPADEVQPADGGPSLRDAALAGVKWMGTARLVAEAAAFAASLALARLIPPAEFGLTVVAMFLATIAQSMSSHGVGSFLVQHEQPTSAHRRAAMLLAIVVGVFGTGVAAAFAVTVAPSLFGERAAQLLLLASPVTFLSALPAVPMAALQRRLAFRRLGMIEAVVSLVTPLVAVGAALAGLDGEAIILSALVAALLLTALAWSSSRPPRPGWFPREWREIARYGAPATGSTILYSAFRNIDKVILAARLPAAQVGYYVRAFQLGTEYQSKISGILLGIAFPVLSRTTSHDEMRRVRSRMMRTHTSLLFPLLFGLIALAPTFVPFLYGSTWTPAAELTQILALGGLLATVGTGTGPLMMATGNTKALFVYNLVEVSAFTAAVLVAVPHGVVAVCWAVVGVRFLTFTLLQYVVVERLVGIPFLSTLRDDVLPAFTAGLCLLAVCLPTVATLDDRGLPAIVVLALPGLLGFGAYALAMRTLFPATWQDLRSLLGRFAVRGPRLSWLRPDALKR